MFDDVPTRVWLLLLIGMAAFAPVRYLVDHVAASPSRRDITRPTEDLSWRTRAGLARNAAIVVALAALAVFIFTPAAERFARSPSFIPVLLAAFGGWSVTTVVRGHFAGRIEPMVRGASWVFERGAHPKRYWASMGWNGLLGVLFLFLSYQSIVELPRQALSERCYDREDRWAPRDELMACNELLQEGGGDKASLMAARGSAFYRAGRYDRAMVDYAAAVRLDPAQSSSYYNIGLIHDLRGRRWQAVRAYGAAIKADPENTDAYARRGLVFLDKGDFDLAIADFTRAHQLAPADVKTLANRGIAYAWKNDAASARRDFARVPRKDAAFAVVLRGEAVLAEKRGDEREAIRRLTAAIDRDPRDTWSLARRAALYGRAGETAAMRADEAALARLEGRERTRE